MFLEGLEVLFTEEVCDSGADVVPFFDVFKSCVVFLELVGLVASFGLLVLFQDFGRDYLIFDDAVHSVWFECCEETFEVLVPVWFGVFDAVVDESEFLRIDEVDAVQVLERSEGLVCH